MAIGIPLIITLGSTVIRLCGSGDHLGHKMITFTEPLPKYLPQISSKQTTCPSLFPKYKDMAAITSTDNPTNSNDSESICTFPTSIKR